MTEKRILIFAGTTEGRRLAETLAENGVPCSVCVATEYGTQVMGQHPNLTLLQGRLDCAGMQQLMEQGGFAAVVDATHPYATAVSANIAESAQAVGVPYLRLKRDTDMGRAGEGIRYFADHDACAAFLEETTGHILLTTGSKELAAYCAREHLAQRLYVRVLPGRESIRICEEAGIPGSRIIALQGPFSEALNSALIQEYQIRWLVTKESGAAGGYAEKLAAAQHTGIGVCIIRNPDATEGDGLLSICGKLETLLGQTLQLRRSVEIALIGAGMGSRGNLTLEAAEACARADYVFGASRLLPLGGNARQFPYYDAERILAKLDELLEETMPETEVVRVAVLFSGDSGFFSGCEHLGAALQRWIPEREALGLSVNWRIYPGISCVSYLAARAGCSWQDAAIVSMHGRSAQTAWRTELLEAVRKREKTFVLTSGVKDVRALGALLAAEEKRGAGRISFSVTLGCSLSYPEEQVAVCTPAACQDWEPEGIYTCLIRRCGGNDQEPVTHGLPDRAFIRGDVPMTKEEVRETAICKLRLTEGAVVYDIGSGTGSVAVEIARSQPESMVYAVEKEEEAAALIRENVQAFGLENVSIVQARAPEGLDALPAPTHVFIGGSDGALREILDRLKGAGSSVRVVVTAVSLETVAELTELLRAETVADAEVVCLQVSRARRLGKHHLMQAQNPVYIVSFTLVGDCTEGGACE